VTQLGFDFDEAVEYTLPATLADGRFAVVRRYVNEGIDRVYLGPDNSLLVSVTQDAQLPYDEIAERLGYSIPGVLPFLHVGPFDPDQDGWMAMYGLVERLPEGIPASVFFRSPNPVAAARVGAQVGRTMLRAAEQGIVLGEVQPESVWISEQDGAFSVTGLSGRSLPFFATGKRITCYGVEPCFRRRYAAPEVWRKTGADDRSLAFSIGAMVAEWATGTYPFPKAVSWYMDPLLNGEQAPLNVSPALENVLTPALQTTPARRQPLLELVEALNTLTAEQLTRPQRM